MPRLLEAYVLDQYGLDLTAYYAGDLRVRNPFGKASGQLSLNVRQVHADAQAGLGFVVLKTVIAVDDSGSASMSDWAVPVTKMTVEPIVGQSGEPGWTVSWVGRGWSESFEQYLAFFDEALVIGAAADMLVVPSVKYHLPGPNEAEWRIHEYAFTTRELFKVWRRHHPTAPMPLEKDFSPTLAGDDRATDRDRVLEWVRAAPRLIHSAVASDPATSGRDARPTTVLVGLKLFNALADDDFQLELLRTADESEADFLIYGNRLFDPQRGLAYGGPDLSDRNLLALRRYRERYGSLRKPLSATGNIHCGAMAGAYTRLGADSFQMHTLFQLPDECFTKRDGSRAEKALHHLLFHPETGWIADRLSEVG